MSGSVLQLPAGPYTAHIVATSAAEGDLALPASPDALAARRRAIADLPWTWMRQVHGATVVRVLRPGDGAGSEADAAATAVCGAALAVQVADCAPVALVGSGGSVGIAHVGWRGLAGGVLPATIAMMRTLSDDEAVTAVVGPCIHSECYEFGEVELDAVARVAGPKARARTVSGRPALDLVAGIESVLHGHRVAVASSPWAHCTSCTPGYWSHRARRSRAPSDGRVDE